jgi:hypothetical protein
MPLEIVPALGWSQCARLQNEQTELLISLEVGPRLLSYRLREGKNVLQTVPAEMGKSGEKGFVGRGGHRLWVSPETERTYAPDNSPVKWQSHDPSTIHLVNPATAPWHIRKELAVTLGTGSAVTLRHVLTNEGQQPEEIAAWGLTIMRPGGLHIIPQPPLAQHGPGAFQPDRVVVPWRYTDLSDPRWHLGRRYWTLEPKVDTAATKLGLLHSPGWVAYALPDALFFKSFAAVPGGKYPDFGCNYETFSKGDFIELETLSPLQKLAPGESVEHVERWHLFSSVERPDKLDESAMEEWLRPFLAQLDHP